MDLDAAVIRSADEFVWESTPSNRFEGRLNHSLKHIPTDTHFGSTSWDDRYGWDTYSGIDHCYVPWGPFGNDDNSEQKAKAVLLEWACRRPDLEDGFRRHNWAK